MQKPKEVNGMRRTKIITEYREPGGDAAKNNIVRMGWGWGRCYWGCGRDEDDGSEDGERMGIKWCGWGGDGYKIFYRVIL